MTEETLHQRLIRELMDDRTSLSPREHAARNEILALRERIEELEGRKGAQQTVEPAAEVSKRAKAK